MTQVKSKQRVADHGEVFALGDLKLKKSKNGSPSRISEILLKVPIQDKSKFGGVKNEGRMLNL